MSFLDILINKVKRIKATKREKNLLYQLWPGFLVWAEMPLSKEELERIEESHRIRPYLVVYKDDANIYAYQCSSSNYNNLNNYEKYYINKKEYNQERDTWIDLTTVYQVPVYKLKSVLYNLHKIHRLNIQKRLQIQKDVGREVKYDLTENFEPSKGDIVEIGGKLQYVFSDDSSSIDCYPLFQNRTYVISKYKDITINGKRYHINFDYNCKYSKSGNIKILDVASLEEITNIEMKRKKVLAEEEKYNKKDNKKNLYVLGNIFRVKKGKVVYLFSKKQKHYGVNLKSLRVVTLPSSDKIQLTDTMSNNKLLKIVELLYKNEVQPFTEIKKLYYKLKEKK